MESSRREGQEGSRWINRRPTGDEVAAWFAENVTLHDEALHHDAYVQGLTLIQQEAEEKEVVGWDEAGAPIIDKRKNLYYVPYAKVETRVKYFWDYVGLHDDWLGIIEPVPAANPISTLPPGFGRLTVLDAAGKNVNYVTYSARARILKRDTIEHRLVRNTQTGEMQEVVVGQAILEGNPGTKMVPTLGRYGPDNFSLMKAETGAVGRALGLIGMLIVPGSGVATAEDMQEASQIEGGPVQAAPTQQAAPEDDDASLRQRVTALIGELGEADKDRLDRFRQWVRDDRKIESLSAATSPQLRGLIRKLEQEIKAAAESNAPAEEA